MNVIGQLLNDNKNIKLWKNREFEFHLKDTHNIHWLQIIDALPKTWKNIILKDKGNAKKVFLIPTLQENLKFVVLTNLLVKSYI